MNEYDDSIVRKVIRRTDTTENELFDLVVDYYKYHDFIQRFDEQVVNGEPGLRIRILTQEEYEVALEKMLLSN